MLVLEEAKIDFLYPAKVKTLSVAQLLEIVGWD
jgi:hypothetical protein